MDPMDIRILEILKVNGRATASEISRRVNLSIPAVSERIKKMEDSDIIQQYCVKINRQKSGYRLLSMVFVNIDSTVDIEHFRETVVQFEEVIECFHMAGEYDYMLKVLLEDTSELETFLSHKLKSIRGVQKTNSLIILSTLKETMNR